MKWKAPRAATTTDTGSQPTRVSRRGGHLVIDGLTAQIHNGLPTSVLPTKPLSRSNDPTIATGQQAQAYFIPVVYTAVLVAPGRVVAQRSASTAGVASSAWE